MKRHSFLQRLSFAAAPALALLVGGIAFQTQAAPPPSPVGDWDFYFSGDQRGVAQITFVGDFTLNGVQIHSPGKVPKVPEDNGRGFIDNPEDPRGSNPGSTNTIFVHYGTAAITGNWGYDLKGKLVGVITLTSDKRTNGLSFRGSVVPGKRMSLRATRFDSGAVSVYQGVPRVAVTDISGDFFLSGKKTKEFTTSSSFFAEVMTLTPMGPVNAYDVVEHGPGYDGGGFAILTANKHLGIYTEHFTPGTTNLDIMAMSGTFNTTKLSGKMGGYDGTNYLSLTIGNPP